MLGVASGLCGRECPLSLDVCGVEVEDEAGQVTMAVVLASAGRGLAWVSLGLWWASACMGSGAAGATAAGKKFSRLSLGCFGVVGVSPEACDGRWEMSRDLSRALKVQLTEDTGRWPVGTQGLARTLGMGVQHLICGPTPRMGGPMGAGGQDSERLGLSSPGCPQAGCQGSQGPSGHFPHGHLPSFPIGSPTLPGWGFRRKQERAGCPPGSPLPSTRPAMGLGGPQLPYVGAGAPCLLVTLWVPTNVPTPALHAGGLPCGGGVGLLHSPPW